MKVLAGEVKPVTEMFLDIQQIEKPGPAVQLKMASKDGFFVIVVVPSSARDPHLLII